MFRQAAVRVQGRERSLEVTRKRIKRRYPPLRSCGETATSPAYTLVQIFEMSSAQKTVNRLAALRLRRGSSQEGQSADEQTDGRQQDPAYEVS